MSGITSGQRCLRLQLLAVAAAVLGNHLLITRSEATAAAQNGVFFLLLGFALWLLAEALSDGPALRSWWRLRRADAREREILAAAKRRARPRERDIDFRSIRNRFWAALLGVLASFLAYSTNGNNHFSLLGFWSWLASILLWAYALAERGDGPVDWLRDSMKGLRRSSWRSPLLLALLGIVLVAGVIRLNDLQVVAPEMTSDHVEGILSGHRIAQGARPVYLTENGGREPLHFYALALLAQVPGLGHRFTTFKLLTVIWGLLSLPCLYWLGRAALGDRSAALGRGVGLWMAALAAVSYWHIMLSLTALRYTTLVAPSALLLIFLAKALREKRRSAYLKAGLVLGFSLYAYQAARALPLVVAFGGVLALLFWARGWRARLATLANLAALALLAFVIFVPLYRFANENPELYWYRAAKLMLDRSPEQRTSLQEFLAAAGEQVPLLLRALRDASTMFHWRGDIQWYNGAPEKPVLDTWAGAFFLLGLAAWLARLLRRRDVFDWGLPGFLLLTLLPSALALAWPEENPSNVRTVASLPIVFLIAALPLATLLRSIWEHWRHTRIELGGAVCALLLLLVLAGGYQIGHHRYSRLHRASYLPPSKPHSEFGRVLRELAAELGYGNVVIFAYPHWLDHRAVAIEAGEIRWSNSTYPRLFLEQFAQRAPFPLSREEDLVFLLHPDDAAGAAELRELFPGGERSELFVTYQPEDAYYLFRVPAAEVAAYFTREGSGE